MKALLTCLCVILTTSLGAQTLYLSDSGNDTLYTVDVNTGAATAIGTTLLNALGTPSGLAHDGTDLFTLDLSGGEVFTIDTNTAVPTLFSNTNLNGWQDITWDASTNQFFAVNQDYTLHSIDVAGNSTLIASTPAGMLITAIAVDGSGNLWAIDFFGNGDLGILDKATGAFTPVNVGGTGFQGMSFDANGVLYGANTGDDSLHIIDTTPGGGGTTLVGPFGGTPTIGFTKGMTFAGGPPSFATVIGNGCTGTGGLTTLITQQPPSIGNAAFALELAGGAPVALAELYVSPAPANLPLGISGCSIYLDVPGLLSFINAGIGPFATTTDAVGGATYPFPIPNISGLVGFSVTFQAVVYDGLAPIGLTTSNGLQIVITN